MVLQVCLGAQNVFSSMYTGSRQQHLLFGRPAVAQFELQLQLVLHASPFGSRFMQRSACLCSSSLVAGGWGYQQAEQ
jgi:hypothetical protein